MKKCIYEIYLSILFHEIHLSILSFSVQDFAIPVVLVENSGRCNKNEIDEKVSHFPDATCLWSSSFSSFIIDVFSSPRG